MAVLVLCFWNSEFIQGLAAGNGVMLFIILFVGINGVVEWIATCVVGGIVSKAVAKIAKNA